MTNPISDLREYCMKMSKSLEDKLFFLGKTQANIFVDFGCADGTLLEAVRKFNPDAILFGYDEDDSMLELARRKNIGGKITLSSDLNEIVEGALMAKDEDPKYNKIGLILSSVLHELYSVTTPVNGIMALWEDLTGWGPDFLFIRDMGIDAELHNLLILSKDEEKLRAETKYTSLLADFEEKWGHPRRGETMLYSNFLHFLLKYPFQENWERELEENYLLVWEEIFDELEHSGYKVSFTKMYTPEFIKKRVLDDFGIELRECTHGQIIATKR